LPESLCQIVAARFLPLGKQLLVHSIEIRIVLDDGAIQAAALVRCGRGIAVIS
jgi:hypothetical protein